MMIIKEVDKLCRGYLIQASALILAVTAIAAVVVNVMGIEGVQAPVFVSIGFSFAVTLADGLIWRRVAKNSPDSLPTFYTAVSGFRMLLALFTLFICYIVVGRDAMMEYCIIFMVFYFVLLIHHSVYFSHVSNSHTKCGKDNADSKQDTKSN